ncbi:MAG: hypothetical protein ACR2Q4_15090 [Geminicoccaceae bacterium]
MTGAIVGLTIAYGMIGLLLLSLHLKSLWSWPVKASAIGAALPMFAGTFIALQALMGWPSDGVLPARFQLHAALVEEPTASSKQAGAIFLWLTPELRSVDSHEVEEEPAVKPELLPRAFALPYSRDLHQRVEAMRERLKKGGLVVGQHIQGPSWKRRFGRQDGAINLFAPPPPPLLRKNDESSPR